jgi:hypothetical protein
MFAGKVCRHKWPPKNPAQFGRPICRTFSLSTFKDNIYKNGKKSVGKSVFGFDFWTFIFVQF